MKMKYSKGVYKSRLYRIWTGIIDRCTHRRNNNGQKGRYDVEWQETVLPAFNPHTCDYRIKPESKYRPFANAEECWQEMQKHQPFGWVKTDEGYEQVWHVNKGDDFTLKTCRFADGTPFGIKEE